MNLSVIVAIVVSLVVSLMLILVPFILARAGPKREPYLKRVAKKYSIPPLNLR